ncbi:prolipoprotein diacylglyceryl transferase [Candidatus Uhrbacteria bacterium]|jgi:phosphatidylglycerol---prolipoprotein diacylglyceryl transferase|nr:prolipoprotein diacylglyceryl transferase [Candidatus Uhrbacteria bacterium]
MIPYIEWIAIHLGPLTLHVWGLFVALGFGLGAFMAGKMAERRDLKKKVIYDLVGWMVIAGMVGGRLGHVLFYEFAFYAADPLAVLRIWEGGLSLFGGIFACIATGVWYLRKNKLDIWQYADVAVFGLPFGLWIGRVGCFLIHDHPGTATSFAMGIEYPDAVIRHDHGMYLSINGLVLALLFLYLAKKNRPVGFYIATFAVWYGIVRFFLDFFRLLDVKYLSLTPGQWFSLLLVAFGCLTWYRLLKSEINK